MNSSKKSAPQHFFIHKSSILIRYLWLIHSLAMIAVLISPTLLFYKLLVIAAAVLNLFFYLRHYHYRFQPYQLRYSDDSDWSVMLGHTFETISLSSSTLITTWFIVLHFRTATGRSQRLVIVKDALSEADYPALVTKLKLSGLDFADNLQSPL